MTKGQWNLVNNTTHQWHNSVHSETVVRQTYVMHLEVHLMALAWHLPNYSSAPQLCCLCWWGPQGVASYSWWGTFCRLPQYQSSPYIIYTNTTYSQGLCCYEGACWFLSSPAHPFWQAIQAAGPPNKPTTTVLIRWQFHLALRRPLSYKMVGVLCLIHAHGAAHFATLVTISDRRSTRFLYNRFMIAYV